MAKRDAFLLRIEPSVLEAIRKWADDEMRSMNAQVEFLLRSKLKEAGRMPSAQHSGSDPELIIEKEEL
jgi:hypothetical protein